MDPNISDAHFYKDLPLSKKVSDPLPSGIMKTIIGPEVER